MAPLDLDKLRQVAQDWNLTVNSSQMPGVPVYKFYARDSKGSPSRTFKPLRMAWGVKEDKDDGWGIGILPMVEILGAIAAEKFPTRNVLEKEMVSMLRSFSAQAQYDNLTNLREALESEEKPACPVAKVPAVWPKFKEFRTSNGQSASSSSSTPATSTPSAGPSSSTTAPGNNRLKVRGTAKPRIKQSELPKYSCNHGMFDTREMDSGIPSDIKKTLVDNANASLAFQTWRSIRSVERRVRECEKETSKDLSLPWSQIKLAIFTGWCLKRGLRDKTVENYISKVRIKISAHLKHLNIP